MTGETDDGAEATATRRISLRVDAELVARFLAARQICEAHGKSLPLGEVVRLGMEAAISEVETTFGERVAATGPHAEPRDP